MTTELNKAETRNSTLKGDFEVEDPVKAASELVHILLNLRHHTKVWDEKFGFDNRNKKRHWEQKADRWIAEHMKEVKIIIEDK